MELHYNSICEPYNLGNVLLEKCLVSGCSIINTYMFGCFFTISDVLMIVFSYLCSIHVLNVGAYLVNGDLIAVLLFLMFPFKFGLNLYIKMQPQ